MLLSTRKYCNKSVLLAKKNFCLSRLDLDDKKYFFIASKYQTKVNN